MKRLMIFLAAALVLTHSCLASEMPAGAAEAFGIYGLEEAVPSPARDILGDGLVEGSFEAEGFLERIGGYVRENMGAILRRALSSAASILTVTILCGLAAAFTQGEGARAATLAAVLAIAVIAAGDTGSFVTQGAQALRSISDFSRALLPCLTAAATAGGAATSAAAKYAATALFMDIFITVALEIILPLVYIFMGVSVAAAAAESETLAGAAGFIKWLCRSVMTLLAGAFTLWLSVSGAVTGAADALTSKAAKTAISAALPVVGGIISNAASTVVAAAGVVKNAVGVLGLVVVLCVCLVPFLGLGAQYLMYGAAAAVSGSFAEKRLTALISALGSAFGMVLGLVGLGALMLFFSILSLIKAVGV